MNSIAGKTSERAMAKVFATDVTEKVCSQAMHLLGSTGYSRDGNVEKYYRDAKALPILEGTSEIQRRTIAAEL